jgi:hypothetical protein
VIEKRAEKPERVRYGESKRTGVLTTNSPKDAGRGFLPMRPSMRPWSRKQMRASLGRILVVGRRVAVNKNANGKDSASERCTVNNWVREKGKESK